MLAETHGWGFVNRTRIKNSFVFLSDLQNPPWFLQNRRRCFLCKLFHVHKVSEWCNEIYILAVKSDF